MNRRTALAIAAATVTTLAGGAVTTAAMSGGETSGFGNQSTGIEAVTSSRATDDSSPTSTRQSATETRGSTDDTSTTTRSTAPTTTRAIEDNPGRSTSTVPPTTTPPATSPTANTTTFRSIGGEVDVIWTARTLTIVAVRPAAGFRAENEAGDGDEVEAEFESATHNSKITVRLVDGAPSASLRERDDNDRVSDDNSSGNNSVDDNSGHGGGSDDSDNSGHGSESNDDHGGHDRG